MSDIVIRERKSEYLIRVPGRLMEVKRLSPDGESIQFNHADYPAYDGKCWDMTILKRLIKAYEAALAERA